MGVIQVLIVQEDHKMEIYSSYDLSHYDLITMFGIKEQTSIMLFVWTLGHSDILSYLFIFSPAPSVLGSNEQSMINKNVKLSVKNGEGVNIYLFCCFCNFYFKRIKCNTVNVLKYVNLNFCGLFLKVIFVGSEIPNF